MSKVGKIQWIKWLKVVLIFVFATLFIAVLITARIHASEVVCSEIDVNLKNGEEFKFISDKDILDYINNNGQDIVINQRLANISKGEIEERIENNDYVAKADVFTNFEGKMKVNVTQKKPIYRVFNNKGVSYYVGEDGESIPISSKFTPRLIVATGNLSNQDTPENLQKHQDLLYLVNYINRDEFWEAMIGQIEVASNGDFILYTKVDEHRVVLGNTENLDEKFKYLRIFYKDALKHVDWTKYKEINLKYKGQIICTKN